jgi:hypothetical protein
MTIMPDIGAWLTGTPIQDSVRALDTARTIADKPASVTVKRGASTLSAQTVRIDTAASAPGVTTGPTATTSALRVLVLGYRDHPTITDTNLKRGDTFLYEGTLFSISQILPETPGRLIAVAEAKP